MRPGALPAEVALVIDGPQALLAQARALAPGELGGVAELEGRVHADGEEAATLLQALREKGVARSKVQEGQRPDDQGGGLRDASVANQLLEHEVTSRCEGRAAVRGGGRGGRGGRGGAAWTEERRKVSHGCFETPPSMRADGRGLPRDGHRRLALRLNGRLEGEAQLRDGRGAMHDLVEERLVIGPPLQKASGRWRTVDHLMLHPADPLVAQRE